jgi:hypothetical protein
VILHGRPDLDRLHEAPELPTRVVPARRFAAPELDDAAVAYGLALGCQQEAEGFNLARSLRPRGSIARLVPWRQLASQAAVLGLATFCLAQYHGELGRMMADVRGRQKAHDWLGERPLAELNAEQAQLAAQADAVRHYLDTRVLWTPCLRELSALLPDNMALASWEGQADYVAPGKKVAAGTRSLKLRMEAPIPGGSTIPAEVDALLGSLRDAPALQRSLPVVKLSTLKWGASETTRRPVASFSIVCSPEEKKAAKPSAH